MIIKERWTTTTYQLHPSITRPVAVYLAQHNMTVTKLFNAFYIALLKGDLSIDVMPEGTRKVAPRITDTFDDMLRGVVIRNKQGEKINVSKYEE